MIPESHHGRQAFRLTQWWLGERVALGLIQEEVGAVHAVGIASLCQLDLLEQFWVVLSDGTSIGLEPVFLVLLEPRNLGEMVSEQIEWLVGDDQLTCEGIHWRQCFASGIGHWISANVIHCSNKMVNLLMGQKDWSWLVWLKPTRLKKTEGQLSDTSRQSRIDGEFMILGSLDHWAEPRGKIWTP